MSARYIYLGDAMTDPALVGQPCDPSTTKIGEAQSRGDRAEAQKDRALG